MIGPGFCFGVPRVAKSLPVVRNFLLNEPYQYPYVISGVTKDSVGTILGDCIVTLFRTADNSIAGVGTSDGSGNYRFEGASSEILHYVVAYKAGSPDVAGTSVNTLIGF